MDPEGWQVVSKKKAGKKKPSAFQYIKSFFFGTEESPLEVPLNQVNEVIKRIKDTMEDIKVSGYWKSCQGSLHKCQDLAPAVSKDNGDTENPCTEETDLCLKDFDCVCYGLGTFASSVPSRHQLAFLLLFLEKYKIPYSQCYFYDPRFSSLETSVLQELQLNIVSKNEEGKRAVQRPTVFYMLHCGKVLYNNVLWKNWSVDALSKMAIIGNSFQGMETRMPARFFEKDFGYIHKSLKVVEETELPEHPDYRLFFNDTSVHCFPLTKLQTFPKDLWQNPEEPEYDSFVYLDVIRNLKISDQGDSS